MTLEFLHRHKAGVIATCLLAFSSLLITLRLEPYIVGLKTTLWFFLSPKVVYSGEFFDKFDSLRGRFFHLVKVEGENTILREQLAIMAKRDMERDALEIENNRLRDLLHIQDKQFTDAVPAEVVGRDIRDWFHSLILNKGRADGVVASAGVVVMSGDRPTLVGRVAELDEHTSKVLYMTDLASAISVSISTRADIGLLEGRNQPICVVRYLSRQSEIAPGDEVVTAGLGGVFPPGVPVGKVTEVSLAIEGFFKTAKVKPFTDFGSVQEVLVLQRKSSSLKGVTSP